MAKEVYKNNPLAQAILQEFKRSNFGDKFTIVPVIDKDITKHIGETIQHLDNKAKIDPEYGYATVFEGLAYDTSRLRSQAIAIYDKNINKPVAISAFMIAPADWIANKRYFENTGNGVTIQDFKRITRYEIPKFLFFPGWVYIDPLYRLAFALPGFHAIKRLTNFIKTSAPANTWAEEIPRGTWPRNRESETLALAKQPIGTYIPQEKLPFTIQTLGQNSVGSASSVKIAKHLGLDRIHYMSSINTLGPIYAKQLA